MKKAVLLLVAPGLVAATISSGAPVYADSISPAIRSSGKTYSKEAPDSAFYGTGIGGRAMEASALRFEIERLLQDAEWDKAIAKARKACQLDPGDPESHLFLARGLTKKLQTTNGAVDEKVLAEAMAEWKLIWLHDADQTEQTEGKFNYMRMLRISRALAKQKKIEMAERDKAKQALAEERAKQSLAQRSGASDEPAESLSPAGKLLADPPAQKHKRFLLF